MGLFSFLRGKSSLPSTVSAHILDPNSGYTQQQWVVGEHVGEDTVRQLGDGANIFVVVTYEAGQAKRVMYKREVWSQVKAQFEGIDKAGAESMRRAMDELNKIR